MKKNPRIQIDIEIQESNPSLHNVTSPSVNTSAPSCVFVRDFAYPKTDPKHFGIYTLDTSSYNTITNESQASWDSFKTVIDGNDLDDFVFQKLSLLLDSNEPLQFTRVKALFPFTKVSEWEMDLEKDEVIIQVSLKTNTLVKSMNTLNIVQPTDRWASMDDDDDSNDQEKLSDTPVEKMGLSIDPPPEEFGQTLTSFLDHENEFGQNWTTCIKIICKGKIVGSRIGKANGQVNLEMHYIGLVPLNYIQKIV